MDAEQRCREPLDLGPTAQRAFADRQAKLIQGFGDRIWPNTGWYNDEEFCRAFNTAVQLQTEVERLRAELVMLYEAVGSEKVICPKCGGCWFVPKQLWGDPRFDCPHCEALEAAREK